MKINSPVTDVETRLPRDTFIYSRTDTKGVISDVNEAFAEISAFTPDEMVGRSHNIVRHPDMPPEAFADLWSNLKKGRPWRGVVKNRRKDGGYYWVVANVSPVRENGRVVGYQSIRGVPADEEVAAAKAAYAGIRQGASKLAIVRGRVVRKRPSWVGTWQSLRTQTLLPPLFALALSAALLFVSPAGWTALLAGLAVAHACYALCWSLPRTWAELDRIAGWLEAALCSGDLRQRLRSDRGDIVGTIALHADDLLANIQATLQGIGEVASQVGNANQQVATGMSEVGDLARRQGEAVTSAASSIEQVTSSIRAVADNAGDTCKTADDAAVASDAGAQITDQASKTIRELAQTVNASAECVEKLGARSAEISRITDVIREIADQTNLLALNAAIEAARAGEQGRGFAVVADEVRKLAERTSVATREIGEMVEGIRHETDAAVHGMRAGATQVGEGVALVTQVSDSLRQINDQMGNTVSMVGQITKASDEQQGAMASMETQLQSVSELTERNVAIVSRAQQTVGSLNVVVDRLRKAVTQYQI